VGIKRIVKTTVVAAAAGIIALVGTDFSSRKVHAQAQDTEQSLAAIGLSIAPSFIKISGQDPTLVGLGSYIVNAQADCNGCHGSDPANEFLPTNNPYWLAPNNSSVKFNPATYLAGGRSFGTVGPGIVKDPKSPLYVGPGVGPKIISRNLTPDSTGNPAGGRSLAEFMDIMRSGHDYDSSHPNCGGGVTDNCYSAPVNGTVLQVMPWPVTHNMTDRQLTAIWTYLSTVPCNAHNDDLGKQFTWLTQTCPSPTTGGVTGATKAVANPKNYVTTGNQFSLDGTASTSYNGKALTYLWALGSGSLNAQIANPTSATPLIYLENGPGAYIFTLTVTDDAGKTASDTTTVWRY
jgi:hypothetical protein